jgi:SulP family sulfate permease
MPDGTSTAHLYLPKLVTVIREGYGLNDFRKDALAGLTVAIVALPLSMAIAVASGVTPERGLYTAIVGGAMVSLLSGSRFQIGGPAGAFIVLVASTVAQFGLDGLLIAVLLSGVFLTIIGAVGLGALIRHVPHAVTVGFTAGIAVTILASQIKDFAGLTLAGVEPGPFIPKLMALAHAAPTFLPEALGVGIAATVIIFTVRHLRPTWPGMLIAVVVVSIAATLFDFPVETVGTKFGGLPGGFPTPYFPVLSIERVIELLPVSMSFTLLGGIESLLSAKVADSMTGRHHRSNMELIAQGLANIASSFFGGISVTGTIARTATNIRAGARSPIAGVLHAVFVLLFILVAAPLASFIPMAALAGILVTVCWNMAEKAEFARLTREWRGACVLLTTFGLTLIADLTFGIIGGCLVAAGLALIRKSGAPKDDRAT